MTEGNDAGLTGAFRLLLPHLDKRQRWLVLGAAALVRGHGGVRLVAEAAGVAASTVSRGLRELGQGEEPDGRVRAVGGAANDYGMPILRWYQPCWRWWSRTSGEIQNCRSVGR